MNVIAKFFAPKTAITSDSVRAEIARSESEIADHRAKLAGSLVGIATMTDSEHIAAEANIASIERALARFESRIAHLNDELPKIIAAEEAAAKAAADEALRQRAEAARKANSKEAAALLRDYDKLASQLADVLDKLDAITRETAAVNEALHVNQIAERVSDWNIQHRKRPDRTAGERREVRKCWVYHLPGSPPDQPRMKFVKEAPSEVVREASFDERGNVIPTQTIQHAYYGRTIVINPKLEEREIVVARERFRSGGYELPLSEIRALPPGFAGGTAHWPRA
jgi:hypothetical protein